MLTFFLKIAWKKLIFGTCSDFTHAKSLHKVLKFWQIVNINYNMTLGRGGYSEKCFKHFRTYFYCIHQQFWLLHWLSFQMIPTTVHPGTHTLDPNSVMPTLTAQMGQLQLSNTSVWENFLINCATFSSCIHLYNF